MRVREREDSKINFVFQSLTTISFKIWPNMKPYTCKLWSVFTLGFSDRTLQDLFGCMNFHENIGTRSSINASCCWMLLTRSKSLKRPYDQLFYKMRKKVGNDYFLFFCKKVGMDLFLKFSNTLNYPK